MKRLLSVILIVALALSMTAFAADDYDYKATADPEAITVDGVITEEEWGEPIFTTTAYEVLGKQNMGWDFWAFTYPPRTDQYFELYVTNDTDNVYIGARLVNADKDTSCPSSDLMWQYPHFTVTFAKYDKDLICPRIEFQGDMYEQYTCFSIGFVNGDKAQLCTSQGMNTVELDADDFSVAYDDATSSYVYELCISMAYTNIDIWSADAICLGVDVTDAPADIAGGKYGNRYLISKAGERGMAWMGPNNFYFNTTNPLIIKLKDIMSLRGKTYIAEKQIIEEELPPTDRDYYSNYEMMTTTAIGAAVAALFAAAAAVTVVLKKKK